MESSLKLNIIQALSLLIKIEFSLTALNSISDSNISDWFLVFSTFSMSFLFLFSDPLQKTPLPLVKIANRKFNQFSSLSKSKFTGTQLDEARILSNFYFNSIEDLHYIRFSVQVQEKVKPKPPYKMGWSNPGISSLDEANVKPFSLILLLIKFIHLIKI